MMNRRKAIKYSMMGMVACLLPQRLIKKASAGYGRCSKCSCPGFIGSGYTCVRGGCGHHYDDHW